MGNVISFNTLGICITRDKVLQKLLNNFICRVRFPDGWILQGTFSVYEPVSEVLNFVTDNLQSPLPYLLVDSATGARLGQEDSEQSLLDLGLVPASLLNFCWDPEIEKDLASQGGAGVVGYLRSELKQ